MTWRARRVLVSRSATTTTRLPRLLPLLLRAALGPGTLLNTERSTYLELHDAQLGHAAQRVQPSTVARAPLLLPTISDAVRR